MKLRIILTTALLLVSVTSSAQNFLTMTAQHIYGTGGKLLSSGSISFQPVDSTGKPISYQVGGGGQQINWPTVCGVANGLILQPCQVANVSLTNPINVCFSATVKNSNNQVVIGGPQSGYTCVQPQTANVFCASGTCNFDQYVPNLPAAITALIGPPSSSQLGSIFTLQCPTGQVVIGYDNTGRPACTPNGGAGAGVKDPGANGLMFRTAFNISRIAVAGDISTLLGYTPANDSGVVHTTGVETIAGAKTFSTPIVGNLTGIASTSSALDHTPVPCPLTQAARGILSNGDSTGCISLTAGLGDPGANGVIVRTAFNTTAIAGSGDIITALGYTPANSTVTVNLTGSQSVGGVKTFTSNIAATAGVTGNLTGNATTASAFDHSPALCTAGNVPRGIVANGDASNCGPTGLADPGNSGIVKRTSFNTTTVATGSDVSTLYGYTPANDNLVMHLSGVESATGAKVFQQNVTLTSVQNRTGDYLPIASAPTGVSNPGVLILDAPNGYLQIQADSGSGANLGGVLNLQSTNGFNSAALASLLVGSSGFQINAAGMTVFSGGGLKTILTGPGITQFGSVGATRGQPTYVGNTSGSVLAGCADATCSSFAISGAPLTLSTQLGTLYGGTGFNDTTFSGTTHKLVTGTGTLTGVGCAQFDTNGNLTNTTVACGSGTGGLADPGANGIIKRTALNVTAAANGSDINSTLGYTPANDTLAAHLAGTETFTGNKTFSGTLTGTLTGNSSTATALAALPTACGAGLVAKGILANGNATGCTVPPAVGSTGAVQLASAGGVLTSDANTTVSSGLLKTLTYGFSSADPNYSTTMTLASNVNFAITQVVVAASGCSTPPCVTFSITTTPNNLSWDIGDRFQAKNLPATPTNLTALNGHDFVVEAKTPGIPTSTILVSYNSGIANGTYASTSPGALNQYAWTFNGNLVVFNRLCSSTSNCPTFGSIRLSSSGPSQGDRITMYDPVNVGSFIALTRATTGNPGRVQVGDSNTQGGMYVPGPAEFVSAATFDAGLTGALTGNATTASALASTPTLCSTNQAAGGILANGNATGCVSPVLIANDIGGTAVAPTVISTHLTGFTTNQVPRISGIGGLIPSSITDDLTTVSIAAPSGIAFTGGGGAAGFDGLGFGTAQTVAPGTIGLTAPTSGTAHNPVWPGAPQSGFLKFSTTVSPTGCTASSTVLCGTYSTVNLASATDVGTSITGPANGGSGVANPTAHGVLLAEATSPFTSLVGQVGQILAGQGSGADPAFLSTVQLGGTSLAATGQLKLCGSVLGCATLQSQPSFTSYNFNVPATAGTAGQPLLSGGGGATAMTYGTLSGTTTAFVTGTGTLTGVGCAQFDVNGNLTNLGTACGAGGGGGVNTSVVPRLAFYTTTTTVTGAANTAIGDGTAAPILSLTGTSLTNESLFVNCTTPTNNCVSLQFGGVTKIGIDNNGTVLLGANVRGANGITYSATTSTGNATYAAGIDSNANQGTATYRGGNVTGVGNFTAGNTVLMPGALTNAAPGASATEGVLQLLDIVVRKGTTVTVGNLACGTAATNFTATDCVTAGGNVRYLGAWNSTQGGSAFIQYAGTITLNLDASSTWAAWDTICTSTTGAAQVHMNGTTACNGTTALRVGYAQSAGAAATTVSAILRPAIN